MSRQRVLCFVICLLLFSLTCARCDVEENWRSVEFDEEFVDNRIDASRTKISGVERIVRTLLIPVQVANSTANVFRNIVDYTVSRLPNSLKTSMGQTTSGRSNDRFGGILSAVNNKFRFIFPGTRWCGDGDIAKDVDDLGLFERTDACCRNHDNCADNLQAQEEKFLLINNGIFTRSHCSCDSAFYSCLKNARSIVATKIGFTYFNLLSPQCFKNEYPIVSCNLYTGFNFSESKCKDYMLNQNEEKKMQWFDNPNFL